MGGGGHELWSRNQVKGYIKKMHISKSIIKDVEKMAEKADEKISKFVKKRRTKQVLQISYTRYIKKSLNQVNYSDPQESDRQKMLTDETFFWGVGQTKNNVRAIQPKNKNIHCHKT